RGRPAIEIARLHDGLGPGHSGRRLVYRTGEGSAGAPNRSEEAHNLPGAGRGIRDRLGDAWSRRRPRVGGPVIKRTRKEIYEPLRGERPPEEFDPVADQPRVVTRMRYPSHPAANSVRLGGVQCELDSGPRGNPLG
ncbi:MAG: hypothetical protein V3U34_07425, partial [candidate division NC10 bacterium]